MKMSVLSLFKTSFWKGKCRWEERSGCHHKAGHLRVAMGTRAYREAAVGSCWHHSMQNPPYGWHRMGSHQDKSGRDVERGVLSSGVSRVSLSFITMSLSPNAVCGLWNALIVVAPKCLLWISKKCKKSKSGLFWLPPPPSPLFKDS